MTKALTLLRRRGLVPATGNPGKIRELRRLLDPLGVRLLEPASLGIELEPEETGATFHENAQIKARAFFQAAQCPVLADDSGLCVAALGGLPGVGSARYGGPGLDDAGRRALLLENLHGHPAPRSATFVCVLALMLGNEELLFVEGGVDGEILAEERGDQGFGYDAVFLDVATGLSFAELTPSAKDERSHRGRALRSLIRLLGDESPSP